MDLEIQSQFDVIARKVIHFQRHEQGYHNLIGDVYSELNLHIWIYSNDPWKNHFALTEIVDAPLTEKSRYECKLWRADASLLK